MLIPRQPALHSLSPRSRFSHCASRARWGALSLAVAALPLAPLVLEQARAPTGLLAHTSALVDSTMQVQNLAHLPGLLLGLLWRGPRVIADAFFAASPALRGGVQAIILAIEVAAAIGALAALRTNRRLVLIALGACLAVIVTVAWMRPVTPYWMAYAMLPLLAGLGALGLHRLCELARSRQPTVWGALIVTLLTLHAATVGAVAATMASGEVRMAVAPRVDVKQDDATAAPIEPWFPAYAVDAGGEMLCGIAQPIVLHGTYAYLADSYFGLDHRLHCGQRDITQLGREPAGAMHLVGLAQPLWVALGWRAPQRLGGLGVAVAARAIHPDRGYAIPDGSVYPPYAWPTGPTHAAALEFEAPRDEAVAISMPHYIWMPKPALKVSANGMPQAPLASDAISAVYACRACAPAAAVAWRVEMDSAAPEWVDVVTLAPDDRR